MNNTAKKKSDNHKRRMRLRKANKEALSGLEEWQQLRKSEKSVPLGKKATKKRGKESKKGSFLPKKKQKSSPRSRSTMRKKREPAFFPESSTKLLLRSLGAKLTLPQNKAIIENQLHTKSLFSIQREYIEKLEEGPWKEKIQAHYQQGLETLHRDSTFALNVNNTRIELSCSSDKAKK